MQRLFRQRSDVLPAKAPRDWHPVGNRVEHATHRRPTRLAIFAVISLVLPLLSLSFMIDRGAAAASSTLAVSVADSSDDARTDDAGKFSSTEASSLVGVGNQRPNVNGYRFNGLAIPRGAVIDSVEFSLVKQGEQWQQFRVELAFEASDSPATFSSNAAPAARQRTAARVPVSDNIRRNDGTRYPIGSKTTLATALQEVVDRPGWKSGNSVALIAHGPATTSWSRLSFFTFDGGRDRAPRLTVVYHMPASSSPAPSPKPSATATQQRTPTPLPTSTSAPSPSPMPSSPAGVGRCGEDFMHWHDPVLSGCATGHEHGDAPPAWAMASRWMPMFDHPGNTPNENVLKHSSFKGFSLRDDNVDIYIIMHLDTNPNGHTSRFHSYQVWARDATGAVSHWDLWVDFGSGNETGPHLQAPDNCGNDGTRPIMMVNYQSGCPGVVFENWYSRAGAPVWGWDMGFNVQPQYYGGPSKGVSSNGDLASIASWLPTGQPNATRRVEMSWYGDRPHPTGGFWSDQWGNIVSGPNDPSCGTSKTFGAKTYTTLCIEQYIAPSMTTVSFPGNAVQKTYDLTGVKLPN